ncbi:hypothetical protein [Desulfotalea psychrophila]|uniref:Uncharacterized protein n=1 Tax=Desulfotalea psychrophila (strain LSv54 / DSM 12343) TaxID=177439 RepID=Q6AJH6_DESPS|nr:hypothetical protein [Desulfotalea psychrophila]CAG37504.1 unknown protein [Desulfotalea psychrophila LSv54]
MVEHSKAGQYDDDLTVDMDNFADYHQQDDFDLLKNYAPESPLTQLKSLVVSLDWDITDENLLQFNQEILLLRDMWAEDQVKLVYLQILEQMSKYIYQKKVDAYPRSVTMLPHFFNSLEKIVSNHEIGGEKEKELLYGDVELFKTLKQDIVSWQRTKKSRDFSNDSSVLQRLKTLIMGVDWEISIGELADLRQEVLRLEGVFKKNKPCLLLLQGIGTLIAYIAHKAGDADIEVFTILHNFLETLEKVAFSSLSRAEEKDILLKQVEEFNLFKEKIATTLSPEALDMDRADKPEEDSAEETTGVAEILPAFADMPADAVHGFDEHATSSVLAEEELTERLDSFFAEEVGDDQQKWNSAEDPAAPNSDLDAALQGVFVGTEDDEEEALSQPIAALSHIVSAPSPVEELDTDLALEQTLAPALSFLDEKPDSAAEFERGTSPAAVVAVPTGISADLPPVGLVEEKDVSAETTALLDEFFAGDLPSGDFSSVDREVLLGGLDVEGDDEEVVGEKTVPLFEPIAGLSDVAPALALPENKEVVASTDLVLEKALDPVLSFLDEESAPVEMGVVDASVEEAFPVGAVEDKEMARLDTEGLVLQEVAEDTPQDFVIAAEQPELSSSPSIDPLSLLALKGDIESLGFVLDKKITQGLVADINELRQKNPQHILLKSFLQLISTLAQHIDRYLYLADDRSYHLLQSLVESMEEGCLLRRSAGEEILCQQTYAVLQWQQDLISRYFVMGAVDKQGEDIATSPVPAEELSVQKENDELLYAAMEEEAGRELSLTEEVNAIKAELEELRNGLGEEISQLRSEINSR